MSKETVTVETVTVGKRVTVLPNQVEESRKGIYKAIKVQGITKAELAKAEVKTVLAYFFDNVTVQAEDIEVASTKLTLEAQKLFVVARRASKAKESSKPATKSKAPDKVDKPKTAKATTEPKPKPKTAKVETKTEEKKEQPTKKEPKSLATFNYFLENSSARLIELSPNNAKTTDLAMTYFAAFNRHLNGIASEEDYKLMKSEDMNKAVDQMINRSTMRLFIEERDKKNKVVCQLLLKPVYMSPYSTVCITEAHNSIQAGKSIYKDIINIDESPLPVYDTFLFNPLYPSLTNIMQDEKEMKGHKVTYKFMNIIAKGIEEEREA